MFDRAGEHQLPVISSDEAKGLLEALTNEYWSGLQKPLPLFSKSSYAYAKGISRGKNEQAALESASAVFYGNEYSMGDMNNPNVYRIYSDSPEPLGEEFQRISLLIFQPILDSLQLNKNNAGA